MRGPSWLAEKRGELETFAGDLGPLVLMRWVGAGLCQAAGTPRSSKASANWRSRRMRSRYEVFTVTQGRRAGRKAAVNLPGNTYKFKGGKLVQRQWDDQPPHE